MRLTKKEKVPVINEEGYFLDFENNGYEIATKLGQLEDIEEELGIDLVKLIECIRNEKGIWKKDLAGNLFNTRCILTCYFGRWQIYDKDIIYDLNDYGKTWSLAKEELL